MPDYPWYKSYDREVPHSLEPYPEMTHLDIISETTRDIPEHTFMVFKDRYFTYRETSALITTMASALTANGVKKGNRVASMLLNMPQQIIAAFGTMKAGGIYVPLNPLYNEEELVHALTTVGAEVIIVWDLLYENIKKVQPRTSLRLVIATGLEDYMPPGSKKVHSLALRDGDVWMDELMAKYTGIQFSGIKLGAGDTAVVLFSGGTTGAPKGAMLSYRNMMAVGMQSIAWNRAGMMNPDDVTLAAMPMFHSYGFIGIIGCALCLRSPLAIVPNPRDIDDLVDTIKKMQPATMPAVPPILIALMEHPEVKAGNVDFSRLKFCLSGAMPIMQ
ncbi:MAG: AMP-binding protein, partial [Dehalococcoidia bacterium]|nr:AMP-binding protein [Dehalococcoidia bacterium]